MLRKGLCVFLASLMVMLLPACAESEETVYTIPETMQTVPSGTVMANDRFSLNWDDESKCVLLEDRRSGQIWSTTPYDFYLSGEYSYSLLSPVVIEYYDPKDNSVQIAKSYDCVENGQVDARMRDGALLVTYYFEEAEITVAISYALREDSLKISLNTDDLEESGKTTLMNVSVVPYLSSAANTDAKDTYLFVPSGSGALMYTDESVDGITRYFSGEVYGNDIARTQLDNPGDDEPVRLPVFGVKQGGNVLLGIVESGAGAARIDGIAGDYRVGYSTVYATFNVRGYNNIEWESGTAAGTAIVNDVVMLNDVWPASTEFAVGYYPLTGDDADYNGMAACYREYLEETKALKESDGEQKAYHVTLFGGAQTKKFLFGLPYDSVLPLTTFDQAQTILQELAEDTGNTPNVLLQGFGTSGMDVGQIGGGLNFSSVLGDANAQQALETLCSQTGISLFTDFDILRFTKSGNGFSTFFDVAQTANGQSVYSYPLKKNVRVENTGADRILYLKRNKLQSAVEAVAEFANDRVSGVGLTTFGRYAYSDYSEDRYMLKGGLSEQAFDAVETLRAADHAVLFSAANAYAAGLSDAIIDVPLQNGGYTALDETIPFYQMVYKGSVPLYSCPLNLALNAETQLLRAVEAGVSPSFTLSYTIDTALSDSTESFYYGILYDSYADTIAETVADTAEYFGKIADASIVSHTILQTGVTETVFDNGVTVTVNHSDAAVVIDGREIPAQSFRY